MHSYVSTEFLASLYTRLLSREVHEDAENIHPKGGIGTTGTSREDGRGERDGAGEGDDILPVQTPHTYVYDRIWLLAIAYIIIVTLYPMSMLEQCVI